MNIKRARSKAKDPRNARLRERLAIADSIEQHAQVIRMAQLSKGHRQAVLPVGLRLVGPDVRAVEGDLRHDHEPVEP